MMGLKDSLQKKTEDIKMSSVLSTKEVEANPEEVREAKNDFQASAEKLEELRAGRDLSDIPLSDTYWVYQNTHMQAHNEQKPRVDDLKTEVKIKELLAKGITAEEVK
jgi:Fic family protein